METAHSPQTKNWYDKSYKLLLIIPAVLIVFSIIFMIGFYNQHGDFIKKDVSLTGGATVTVFDSNADAVKISEKLKGEFPDIVYRVISDFRSGQQKGFSVETASGSQNLTIALERELGYKLTTENSSVEFSGATLSEGFYSQLINAIIAAFLLMSWVVFIIFSNSWKVRAFSTMLTFFGTAIVLNQVKWLLVISTLLILAGGIVAFVNKRSNKTEKILAVLGFFGLPLIIYLLPFEIFALFGGIVLIALYLYNSIPSFAVIFSAFADIFLTLVVVDIMGISVSSAGIIAFLMLIGYSVDTDILLTSRLLRNKEGNVNHRLFEAFKTGITMTLTAIAAVGISFLLVYSFSSTLRQIFGIILIGLVFDIMNTWITNASMLKWFMEAKHLS
ncbi:MAG: hypothetical protein AABX66_01785 [Nanoarchaeota archaeon]